MATKKIIAGVILVLGLGVSIYMWSTVGMGEDQGDQTVAQKMMDFTCPSCKKTFQLSVADAGAIRRANNGEIICQECGAAGAQKNDVEVVMSGGGGFKQEEEQAPAEEAPSAEPAKPKMGSGGRKKIE